MKNYLNHLDIRFWAAFSSILLSCICLAQVDVINNDGILYLRTAETFENGNWLLAHQLYHWPFYSFLIYLTHTLTHLSFEYSAYLLNTFFFAIATVCFVDITEQLQFEKKYVWFSLLLFSLFPLINDYRNFIIRDAGFLAFYLLSLRSLFIYVNPGNIKSSLHLLGWLLFMSLACLFRVEGFIYLFITPLLLLLIEKEAKERFKIIIFLATPVAILFIFIGFLMYVKPQYILKNIDRIQELYEKVLTSYAAIVSGFCEKIPIIHDQILNIFSNAYSTFFLASGITCYYFLESVRAFNPVCLLLIILGSLRSSVYFKTQTRQVLLGYILLCFLTTYLFTLRYFFLSNRYLLPMVVTALFFAIPGLKLIEEKFLSLKKYPLFFFKGLLFLMTLYIFLEGITHFGYSKLYVKDASLWVKQHFSTKEKIYSNSRQIMYATHIYPEGWDQYSLTFTNIELLEKQKFLLKSYDILVLDIPKTDEQESQEILNTLPFQLEKTFQNKRGDAVYIYVKRQSNGKNSPN